MALVIFWERGGLLALTPRAQGIRVSGGVESWSLGCWGLGNGANPLGSWGSGILEWVSGRASSSLSSFCWRVSNHGLRV